MQGTWRHPELVNEQRTAQIRKGVVELAVLALLASGERYGSQIVDELAARPALALTSGTVYPLLARLLKAGLIASTWRESPVGPPRKYYALTDAGRTRLIDMAAAYRAVSHDLTDLLKDLPR